MKSTNRSVKLLGLALVLALVAAACGGDDTTSGGGVAGEPEVSDLTVGVIPIFDVVPLSGAIADGTFADEGLAVETENAAGGAAIVPGVVAGDFEFGFSNVYSVMQAVERGLDLRIVAPGSFVGGDADEDFTGIMSIEFDSLAELEGTTIAVNTLGNLVEINVRETMDRAGLDPDTVEFIELAFPDMVGALEAGQVDAIAPVEPFVGAALGAGANKLATPFSTAQPNMMVAVWFTTGEFADSNPNTVAAFAETLNASNERAQSDRSYANDLVVEFTATPSLEAAEATVLPIWNTELDLESLETSGELGVKWGALDSPPDIDALIG